MNPTYTERLRDLLESFDLEQAWALSKEMHAAEADGVIFSSRTDRLWRLLTDKIEAATSIDGDL